MKSYEEMAREAEAVKDTEAELEGLVPVKARVSKDPRSVYSVRLRFGELSEIIKAAEARGLTTSEFMRQASLSVARGDVDLQAGEQREALLMIRESTEQLYQALEKLDTGTEGANPSDPR
jgi:hypothetical protein